MLGQQLGMALELEVRHKPVPSVPRKNTDTINRIMRFLPMIDLR